MELNWQTEELRQDRHDVVNGEDSGDYMSHKVWKQWKLMEERLSEIEKKGFTMIERGRDETVAAAAWEKGRGGLKRLMLHRWR